jgi:hypothetical protein
MKIYLWGGKSMLEGAFNKIYWGFLFIMIDFRLQGIDVLPDIIGYLLFAGGLTVLASSSSCFEKAKRLNVFMIVLSVVQIYERPTQGGGINFGVLGPFGFLIGIAATILNLIVIYNLFMGIRDIANVQGKMSIGQEAEKKWSHYLLLQLSVFLAIVFIIIPPIAFIFVIVIFICSIVLTFTIMSFIKRCGASL